MVMLDKDLAIICKSVLTGRITYGNTIKWALRHTIFVLPKLSAHEGAYCKMAHTDSCPASCSTLEWL